MVKVVLTKGSASAILYFIGISYLFLSFRSFLMLSSASPELKLPCPADSGNNYALPREDLYSASQSSNSSVAICIITNAESVYRLQSLKRLLSSIQNADYSSLAVGEEVRLVFNLDASASDEAHRLVLDFPWKLGAKTVKRRVVHGGLIAAVAEAWEPLHDKEVGLLLEDDIELSPLYFTYLKKSMNDANPSKDPRIMGISLYTPRRVEVVNPKFNYDSSELVQKITGDPTMPYFQQLPCSWGAAFYAPNWNEFLEYMRERLCINNETQPQQNTVHQPSSLTSGWQASWKKFLIELMYTKGWYMLYPSFPNQTALSTNHLEVGEHITANDKAHLPEHYTIPLMTVEDYQRLSQLKRDSGSPHGIFDIPDLHKVPVMDLRNIPFTSLEYLTALVDNFKEPGAIDFDYHYLEPKTGQVVKTQVGHPNPADSFKNLYPRLLQEKVCKEFSRKTNLLANDDNRVTILISTFDRLDVLRMQLNYYTRSDKVAMVIVTWQNMGRAPPPPMLVHGKMVHFLQQGKDTLNNRFFPHMLMLTQAVLVIDDDIKLHLDDVDLLFEVWQRNKEKLVGFFPRKIEEKKGKPVYQYLSIEFHDQPYHMMLTKSFMLDKKYLEAFSCDPGMDKIRSFIDESMNCEDIAMNFVVWNSTKKAVPLFVEPLHHIGDFGTPVANRLGAQPPLHKRKMTVGNKAGPLVSHNDVRSSCVRMFMSDIQGGRGDITTLPEQTLKVQHDILPSKPGEPTKIRLVMTTMGSPATQYRPSHAFIANCAYNGTGDEDWIATSPKPDAIVSSRVTSQGNACHFREDDAMSRAKRFYWAEKN